tara:strand:+ start:1476 stop:1847 length:372 start_codon:yes stop_codon:yes gene_type:complete
MAHYAFLNMENIVTEVITGKDETDGPINWEIHYGNIREQVCKRTSYNTRGGQHLDGGTAFRKNYAGIGYTYDYARDAFIPPKPFPSWTLDENTCLWKAPVEIPSDDKPYEWNEDNKTWIDGTN